MKPGFLWSDYPVYVIKVPEAKWQVERKEADFFDLRAVLVRQYLGYIIPALPQKPLENFAPEALGRRTRKLQFFLDELLKNNLLSSSKLVTAFLSKQEKEFEGAKTAYNQLEPPKTVAECTTPEGSADVGFSHELSVYCGRVADGSKTLAEKFAKYFRVPSCYHRLKMLEAELGGEMERMSATVGKMAAIHAEIAETYKAIEEPTTSELFHASEELLSKLSDVPTKLQKIMNEHFDRTFRNWRAELDAIDELLIRWQASRAEAIVTRNRQKEKRKLQSQKLGKQPDPVARPQSPSASEVLDLERHRDMYGYYCNKVSEEFRRAAKEKQGCFLNEALSVADAAKVGLESVLIGGVIFV